MGMIYVVGVESFCCGFYRFGLVGGWVLNGYGSYVLDRY